MTKYLLSDLDVFYISFDEPNSEANWKRITSLHAPAKRVHGVLGFDRAHRTCALASSTNRFVTIDGDNWLHDHALHFVIDDEGVEDACFSFKSQNLINSLEYGNGGIKVWDRQTFLDSHTHEKADTTDFCWDIRYYQVDTIASITVQNCTPFQAWRAGFREGIKMSYIDGQPLRNFAAEHKQIWRGNYGRMMIWCTVGSDIENGIWAMLGARMGIYHLYMGKIENTVINDYLWFADRWQEVSKIEPHKECRKMRDCLLTDLNLYLPDFDQLDSDWFKSIWMNPVRQGLMR